MKNITKIAVLVIVAVLGLSCFKDEKQGTRMHIALYSQNVTSDPIMKTTSDIKAYAFEIAKGEKWEIASWEDALNHVVVNTDDSNKKLDTPFTMASYDPEAEYQLVFDLWDVEHTLLVVVDKSNKICAIRHYDTPMNLPEVRAQLHLYAHKKSGSANGWSLYNPFPDEKREPLVPTESTDEQ